MAQPLPLSGWATKKNFLRLLLLHKWVKTSWTSTWNGLLDRREFQLIGYYLVYSETFKSFNKKFASEIHLVWVISPRVFINVMEHSLRLIVPRKQTLWWQWCTSKTIPNIASYMHLAWVSCPRVFINVMEHNLRLIVPRKQTLWWQMMRFKRQSLILLLKCTWLGYADFKI